MKTKIFLLGLAVMIISINAPCFARETGGVGDGGGSDTFENALQQVRPLGLVLAQSKAALVSAGFRSSSLYGESEWNGPSVKWSRTFVGPKTGETCQKVQIEVLAGYPTQAAPLQISEVKTVDLGLTSDATECH